MKLFKWRSAVRSAKKNNRKTVLVVDDEPNIVRTVADRLEMSDYDVITAASGEEALERARADAPDVIVLDIGLPGIDGHAVLERLRHDPATQAIPVIMLTVKSHSDDVMRANAAGAAGYMVKPFDFVGLLEQIGNALKSRVGG